MILALSQFVSWRDTITSSFCLWYISRKPSQIVDAGMNLSFSSPMEQVEFCLSQTLECSVSLLAHFVLIIFHTHTYQVPGTINDRLQNTAAAFKVAALPPPPPPLLPLLLHCCCPAVVALFSLTNTAAVVVPSKLAA